MAERGQRTTIRLGPSVAAEVSLLKMSGKPREAQHETKRVEVTPVAPGEGEPQVEAYRELTGAAGVSEMRVVTSPEPPTPQPVAEGSPVTAAVGGDLHDPLGPEPDLTGTDSFAPLPDADELMEGARPEPVIQQGVTGPGGAWVDLTDELASIDERTKLEAMEVGNVVDSTSIPRERVREAYYVAPAGDGAPKVLALLWHGLRERRGAALVRWTKRTNQALGAIVARGTAADAHLVLLELEWQANMKDVPRRAQLGAAVGALRVEGVTEDVDLATFERARRERKAAEKLVGALWTQPAVFESLRDERSGQRADLLNAAREGRKWQPPAEPAPLAEVVELAALVA